MSQSDFGNLSSPLSGANLIDTYLEPWRDALHSMHSGNSRPSYVAAGMLWLDTATTPWVWKLYDGSDDITIGTINATTNQFIPSNIARWGGSAGGSANALTLTPTPALAAAAAGVAYDFIVTAANTSEAPTLNISGTGAKSLKCSMGAGKVNLPKGALQSGMLLRVVDDGTDYIVTNVRTFNASADIATAATVNLDNASGDYVLLTGTTTITAFTLKQGLQRTIVADGIFIITDSSGNSPPGIICPGSANITTAAGDIFVVRGEANGTVRIVNYQRADGTALVANSGLVLLDEITASSDATIDFTTGIDATYDLYELHIFDHLPATNNTGLRLRTSTDGGSTFDSGASNYDYALTANFAGIGSFTSTNSADSKINLSYETGSNMLSNTSSQPLNGKIRLWKPTSASTYGYLDFILGYFTSGGVYVNVQGGGLNANVADIDAFQLYQSSGNIASGNYKLYGVGQ